MARSQIPVSILKEVRVLVWVPELPGIVIDRFDRLNKNNFAIQHFTLVREVPHHII